MRRTQQVQAQVQNRTQAARKVVAPKLKSPESERGLTHSPYFNGPLYERMSEDLHLGGMSKRTHEGYLRAVRTLADFWKLPPDQISEDQLRKFFLHLKNDRKFASGSLRVGFSGTKFFYTRTCKRNWQTLAQMRIKDDKTLPEVLTIEQVHQIIDACATTSTGSGVRAAIGIVRTASTKRLSSGCRRCRIACCRFTISS